MCLAIQFPNNHQIQFRFNLESARLLWFGDKNDEQEGIDNVRLNMVGFGQRCKKT
jgi:hypothetical protein